MQDALISARDVSYTINYIILIHINYYINAICSIQANFDVFNALDLMDNKEFLEPLKFGVGDGNLQYYLYNWKCPEINSNKVIN